MYVDIVYQPAQMQRITTCSSVLWFVFFLFIMTLVAIVTSHDIHIYLNSNHTAFATLITMLLEVAILLNCLSAVKGTTFNVTLAQNDLARYDHK